MNIVKHYDVTKRSFCCCVENLIGDNLIDENTAFIGCCGEEAEDGWCKIREDNRDITEGRTPAMGYYTALELVAKLVDLLQERGTT